MTASTPSIQGQTRRRGAGLGIRMLGAFSTAALAAARAACTSSSVAAPKVTVAALRGVSLRGSTVPSLLSRRACVPLNASRTSAAEP
jgi:hypothetical protein